MRRAQGRGARRAGVRPILPMLLAGLAAAATFASAESLSGSLAVQSIYVDGAASASSRSLVTQIGGIEESFTTPPAITLSAESVRVDYRFIHQRGMTALGQPLVKGEDDPTQSRSDSESFQGVQASFSSWTEADAELVAAGLGRSGPGDGRADGSVRTPTALRALGEPYAWRVGPDDGEVSASLGDLAEAEAAAGSLILTQDDFAKVVEYAGNFKVYVYGADFTLDHKDGRAHYETGTRRVGSAGVDGVAEADSYWFNLTVLTVVGGRLAVDPAGNAMTAYGPDALLAGTGAVYLHGASGHLVDGGRRSYHLADEDANLVGDYALAVRGDPAHGGFVAGVDGQFATPLFVAQARHAALPWSLWGGLALVGLVSMGGAGGLVYWQRARRLRGAKSRVPKTFARVGEGAPARVTEAAHLEPGFSWRDVSQEFGVIRAGERDGVMVVLVPADRADQFIRSVASRGVMAEDSGDRVQAGEHELAVVILEPTPVMLN